MLGPWCLCILAPWSLGHLVSRSLGLLVSWSCGALVSGPVGLLISRSLCLWSIGLLASWSLGLWSLCLSPPPLSLSLPHSCYVRSEGEKRLSGQIDFSKGVYIHLLANTVLDILGAGVPNMGRGGGTANR